ncbi:hypothetical protein ACH4YO_18645 [Streptomyces noursei]|uniref:hypothetical protein n=1 Tax=Streptomyces noursei TaxID=1971 RepID=UPI0033E601BB
MSSKAFAEGAAQYQEIADQLAAAGNIRGAENALATAEAGREAAAREAVREAQQN